MISATQAEMFGRQAQRRVEYWTLALGGAAAAAAAGFWNWQAAGGVALGAVLAWLNYRWLKQGVASIAATARAQADAPRVRVPISIYLKMFGRYALLAAALYVILMRFHWPAPAFLCGLFTLVAAVLIEAVCELARYGGRGRRSPRCG